MADIVDATTRSLMMSKIRSKDTKPEIAIRKKLFSLGLRYRLHDSKLAGKPDIILPKYNAVIFFNGCFWHKHDCELFRPPKTRIEFWKKKLNRNVQKDTENRDALLARGWRVLIIWECAIRGAGKKKDTEIDRISDRIVKWLSSNRKEMEIRG
jgi:DNA mismatch endonuclease (patch repair protein)